MANTPSAAPSGLTPEIAELIEQVEKDAESETRPQMDTPTPPKVEPSPAPETRSTQDELAYRLKQQ